MVKIIGCFTVVLLGSAIRNPIVAKGSPIERNHNGMPEPAPGSGPPAKKNKDIKRSGIEPNTIDKILKIVMLVYLEFIVL